MNSEPEIAEKVRRYVRGEMSVEEAEAFEDLYFKNEEIARQVEAEQILARASDLLGTAAPAGGSEISPAGWPSSLLRGYAIAASVLFLPVAAALVFLATQPDLDRESGGSGTVIDGEGGLAAIVANVRLSPMRIGGQSEPTFRLKLPEDPAKALALELPLPPNLDLKGEDRALVVTLTGEGDISASPIWTSSLSNVGDDEDVSIILQGHSLQPGAYMIEMTLEQRHAADRSVAQFRFQVTN